MPHKQQIVGHLASSGDPSKPLEIVVDSKGVILSAPADLIHLARDRSMDAVGRRLVDYMNLRSLGDLESLTDLPLGGSLAFRNQEGVMELVSMHRSKVSPRECVITLRPLILNQEGKKDAFLQNVFHPDALVALRRFATFCSQLFGIPHMYIGREISTVKGRIEVFAAISGSNSVRIGSEHAIDRSPCKIIYERGETVMLSGVELDGFDESTILPGIAAKSFLGVPIFDEVGEICTHISMFKDTPFDNAEEVESVFAALGSWLYVQCQRVERDRERESVHKEYRDLFDGVYDGILLLDADSNLVRANKAMSRYIAPDDELLPLEYVLEEDRHIIMQLREEVRTFGFSKNKRFRVRSVHMGIRTVEVSASARYTADGRYDGMQEIVRDITEQEDSRLALIASEHHHQLIFNKSEVGLVYVSQGLLSHINPHTGTILGCSPIDLIGCSVMDLIMDDDKHKFRSMVESIQSDKAEVRDILRFKHSEGSVVHILCTINSISEDTPQTSAWLMTLTDISQRIAAEEEIRGAQDLYRSLVETSPAAIVRTNGELNIEFMSSRVRELHGLGQEDEDLNFADLIHPDQREEIMTLLQGVAVDEAMPISFSAVDHEEEIYCQGAAKALVDRDGNQTGLLLCYVDLTELIRYERSLQQSQARYRNIVRSSPSGIAIFDAEFEMVYTSPRTLEIFGYSGVEEFDTKIFGHIHADDLGRLRTYLDLSSKTGVVQQGRFRARHYQGHYFMLESYVSVRQDENGNREHLFILNDISKLLEFERELEKEKTIYQSLIANSFDGIDIQEYELDDHKFENGKLIIRNEVMRGLLALDGGDDPADLPVSIILGACEKGGSASDQLQFLQREKVLTCTWKVRGKTKDHYLEGVLQIIGGEDANFVVRILQDVTSQRESSWIIERQMEDLNLQNMELERYIESNLQLENFAYIASHDLKAPARSIGSFAELLNNAVGDKLEERESRFLSVILKSSKHMTDLIDDLLAYSKVNTEGVDFTSIDPTNLIGEVVQDFHGEIKKSRAEIVVHEMPSQIIGDKIKLRQLLTNLMANSLKFQKADALLQIEISCKDDPLQWCFTFKDNGIGIDEKYSDKVFLLFQKLHSSDMYEGSGMGLAICKKIIDQHEGKIWVNTSQDQGASISFTISKSIG